MKRPPARVPAYPPAQPPARSPARPPAPGSDGKPGSRRPARAASRRPPRRPGMLWRVLRILLIVAIWLALVAGAALLYLARDLPRPETALDAARRPGLALLDRDGNQFAAFGDVVGEPLRLKDLPRFLPEAAVSVEDRRFWSHPGIDLVGIARAVFVNLRSRRLVQGGSTLTQQVAKNLFLTNARTLRRKVQELMLTVWLEHSFTKAEILEIWLNRVYLGSGTWGVDAASRLYFGISARRLNLWQAAVLAGIPRAPSRFNPRTDAGAAATRGREVLAAMAETGAITPQQEAEASKQIAFPARAAAAGWFADWVADAANTVVPPNADATIRTSLDPRLQAAAEARLSALIDGPGAAAGVSQGAVVVLDAGSGLVRAMVGGRDYRSSPYNRAVSARRQPGSAFKPFVFLAALEAGYTPADTVLDAPIRIGTWAPQNFDHSFRGEITLEDALAHSVNTASIRLLQEVGGPRVVKPLARRLGIASPLPDDLSLALGTGEVGLLELAGAYATIFNGGRLVTPSGVEAATANRLALPIVRPAPERVLDSELAAELTAMLAAVVSRGSGKAAATPGRFTAGKTGTTQDFRDAWFIGEAGSTVIAVWLGNDDGRPTKGVSGSTLPAQLFRQVAAELR